MNTNKCYISVSEPWDFNSPDGENIIKGVILKIISTTCLVFRANYLLDFDGVKGDKFILSPRYLGSNFYDLDNGLKLVTVNGALLMKEYDDSLDEEKLKDNSKFVIIGSIRN